MTDFSDWKSSKWGDTSGLWGYMYSYQGPSGSTMTVDADASAKRMHVTGSVMAGDYGGAGISFGVCATVASFSHVQFTLSGSSPGCDMELQIKTFDQQPIYAESGRGLLPRRVRRLLQLPRREADSDSILRAHDHRHAA